MAVAELKLLSNEALDLLVSRIDEISTLPSIATRVLEVANDPTSDAADLTQIIEIDVALSARIMREVNNSATGLADKITNLQQAISYLGMKQVRNIAIATSVCDKFRRDDKIGSYSRSGLWNHMVAVGVGARLFANRKRNADPEDAFLAGLLHDIGIIVIDQNLHKRFKIMLSEMKPNQVQVKWEKEFFGYDHTQIGYRVAKAWGLPEPIVEVIQCHHRGRVYGGAYSQLMLCVEVANQAAQEAGYCSLGERFGKVSKTDLEAFDMTPGELTTFSKDLIGTLKCYEEWLV